jgi:hypothetical protein
MLRGGHGEKKTLKKRGKTNNIQQRRRNKRGSQ